MSSHADTIRAAIDAAGSEGHLVAGAWDALDALLAENQRLREALQLLYFTRFDEEIPAGLWEAAREALAGATE